jgi:hypothetical protein
MDNRIKSATRNKSRLTTSWQLSCRIAQSGALEYMAQKPFVRSSAIPVAYLGDWHTLMASKTTLKCAIGRVFVRVFSA